MTVLTLVLRTALPRRAPGKEAASLTYGGLLRSTARMLKVRHCRAAEGFDQVRYLAEA